jgi:tRNA 2-thiouridine synthesizing protein A
MNERVLDVRGLKCPMPIVKAKKELATVQAGEVLKILATDPGSVLDFQGWAKANPNLQLIGQSTERDETGQELYIHRLARRS